ncbi:ABC transporter ATP-binding protein [Methylorubrum suomiense]
MFVLDRRTASPSRPAYPRSSRAATARAPWRRMVAGDEDILAVEGLSLSFGGAVAFAEIDLSVAAGEIHAIIGPNGAGKSSLINAITGLYAPQAGRLRIGDARFARVPARRLAELGVARTFQNLALFKSLSVVENVLSGLANVQRAGLTAQLLGLSAARREATEHRARAESVIDFLQLGMFRGRAAGSLPYGLQKRVELARALVANPRLLLLDEPMAGMSAAEKAEMSGFVLAAREMLGTAIVLIEHDIGVVMRLSDRITVLDHGRRIATGTPHEIQANPAVIAAYLGAEDDPENEAKAA